MKIFYKVTSDNFENQIMTAEAYEALRLSLSTGDYSTHNAVQIKKLPKGAQVLTLKDLDPEAYYSKIIASYPKHLKDFLSEKSFKAQMKAGGLDSYSNYSGEDLGCFVSVVSQNRDSDIMQKSNFESVLKDLGGESESVQVHRFGHWACGWFETVFVDPADQDKLQRAYEIHKALQDYPVFDDSDYSEKEAEERESDFDYYGSQFERSIIKALGLEDYADGKMSRAERKLFENDLNNLARFCHEQACANHGVEDAFVDEDSAIALMEDFERSNGMIADLPLLGDYVMSIIRGGSNE